ncbi:MAG: TonB-dependent receptor [Candidatus Desulfofervidaceae bacterium]|nr:TonB-dependent receptor [Candidatus Desulfofervidaceae bacterium]
MLIFTLVTSICWGEELTLPPLVVTASHFATPQTEIGREIEVITAEEIERLPVHSVNELLEYMGSVDVRTRGVAGIQTDFSLRGSNFEEVLILVDGMRVNDPQTGHHHGDIPVSLEEIERIEVIPGGASALYGHGGFGGVINIITKKKAKPGVSGQYAHGEYDYHIQKFGFKTPSWKDVQLRLNLERQLSNGYRPNTDFDHKLGNIWLNGKNWQFLAAAQDKKFGANGFYTTAYPWQWEHTQTQFYAGRAELPIISLSFKPAFFYRRHDDHFLLDRTRPDFYTNTHKTSLYGTQLPIIWQGKQIRVASGLDITREEIKSTRLDNHFRWHEGMFFSLNPHFAKLNANLDLRVDNYSGHLGTEISHNLAVAYRLTPDLKLRAATGRSFRIPSFTELYYWSPANQGNPDLKPEHAWHLEGGVDLFQPKWQTGATIFYRWGRDIIDWVNMGTYWQAQNLTRVNTSGATLNFTTWWHGHTLKLDYTYLNQTTHPAVETKYAGGYLKHKADLILISRWPWQINTSFVLSYQKRLGQTAYPLLDARVEKAIQHDHGQCHLFIEGKNLLDADYEDIAGVPMPGIWVWGGVKISL